MFPLSNLFTRSAEGAQTKALVAANTAFACDLYSRLKNNPGNLFLSPYSISTCLAMTYAGARGTTEQQMAQVLHFDHDQNQVHSSFAALQRQLKEAQQQEGIELNIANALWTQPGHSFLRGFLNTGKNDYQASLDQADFTTGAETARSHINEWVAGQTKNRIQNVLPPGSLGEYTRLVLANAIYFKGKWAKPFKESWTSEQPFQLPGPGQVRVPLMHHTDGVRYMETDDFQAVELPYIGDGLAMLVLLPRRVDACGSLEERLSELFLADVLRQMKKRQVEIFLPRFKMESSFALSGTLAKMGMADAFSAKADFSGIDGTRELFISKAFHKAWVEVKEEGTEAAAATIVAVAAGIAAPPPPRPVFRADHPFIFLIRDTRFGSVLFLGRLTDPTK